MMGKKLLIRDTREKTAHGWDWPEDNTFAGTKIATLKYGDYSIEGLEHLIFIERKKSTAEFAANCCEDRFERLLEKGAQLKYKFCILEFDFEDILTFPINSGMPRWQWNKVKISPAFLVSTLSKMSIDFGIHVMYGGNAERAERLCYSILKRIYKNEVNV